MRISAASSALPQRRLQDFRRHEERGLDALAGRSPRPTPYQPATPA